ncbi:Abca3 protein [Capsaspora owczarzaki ATCC 30864]|uniref:Abca3 protein n=1 Tax=Capsaspora owczarzaki (strain ATCC 30864) TaxID=595528 RepID=A0A0D2UR98_CAPO3|nr:Abca3 protein [Capsaspora owczarzaki ATCC 30864]KJE97521.1 Abca3 protein [Capsaspora owczarzaki ATCC 30864]|eukprot:XP_004343224.1 Abca3 protein [Capsaspora owczarzaki ATCC 30864]
MRNGRSIILTSHSMEECEALCTRLAIMVNGEFKCIDSPQHLKNRFGSGYTMTVKLQRDLSAGAREPDTFPVKQFVHETFPGAVLKEEHQGALHYEIATPEQSGSSAVKSLSWAFIFSKMEEAKRMDPIEDYGVSQTSLEQVFIEFAKRQQGVYLTQVKQLSVASSIGPTYYSRWYRCWLVADGILTPQLADAIFMAFVRAFAVLSESSR